MRVGVCSIHRSHCVIMLPLLQAFPHLGHDVTFLGVENARRDMLEVEPGLDGRIEWDLIPHQSPENAVTLLERAVERSRRDLDLLLIDGIVTGYAHMARLRYGCPTVFYLHDLNSMLQLGPRLKKLQPRRIARNWSILRSMSAISVLGDSMLEAARRYPLLRMARRPVCAVPLRVFRPEAVDAARCEYPRTDDKVTFTVTGYVQRSRRNYDLLLDAFEELNRRVPGRARLVLLGRTVAGEDASIIQRCRRMTDERNADIVTFDEYVSPREHQRWLSQTDAAVSVHHPIYSFPDIDEQYSISKPTGLISDRIEWGLPALLPSFYRPEPEVAKSSVPYAGAAGLCERMEELIRNPKRLRQLADTARREAEVFSLDYVAGYLKKHIVEPLGR